MPEYFGYGSPHQFIQMFNSFCALSGVQDAQKAMVFIMTLQDSAKRLVLQTFIKAMTVELHPFLLAKQPKTYSEGTDLIKTVQGVRMTTEDEKVTALQQQVATLTQLVESGLTTGLMKMGLPKKFGSLANLFG